jgi:hypothetical protein
MDNDTQALAGCITIFALLIVAPFVIMATPVLLGAAVGLVAMFLIGAIISAIFGAIFK